MRQVAVLARAPSSGGKTRLTTGLAPARAAELRRCLLEDTLDAVRRSGVGATLFFTPAAAQAECAALAGGAIQLRAQTEGDLGVRMREAIASLFSDGAKQVVLIGSDLPTLPAARVGEAFGLLDAGADVVVGPAEDGGYYLIGLNQPQPELFAEIAWGRSDVLAVTATRARQLRLQLAPVGEWYDVDLLDDLRRVAESAEPAPRTRAWYRTFTAASDPSQR